MALAAQANPEPQPTSQADARALQETKELRDLRESFSQVLDAVRDSWFGKPYQQIKAVDINGSLALAIKGSAMDTKIEQLTQGIVKSAGIKSGQALCTLEGTYFANGDHLYKVGGDMGTMQFQRIGERGFWYVRDANAYTTSIDSVGPNAPLSFMGWFADMISDIKNVYVAGSTFQVSKGKDATVGGKVAQSVVFNAPTAAYDPRKREQSASETFSFWKKGRLEVTFESATKQPIRMEYANIAQGIEATLTFTYDNNGRIRRVDIANRSKQWEGPGFVSATYNPDGMMTTIQGELNSSTHKIMFSLGTKWNTDKPASSLRSNPPAAATKLGREDFELRLAMMFAGNIGDLQSTGFNFMAPKVTPVRR
jgi:hypothetical protein